MFLHKSRSSLVSFQRALAQDVLSPTVLPPRRVLNRGPVIVICYFHVPMTSFGFQTQKQNLFFSCLVNNYGDSRGGRGGGVGGLGRRKGTTVNSLLGQRNVFVIKVDEKETSREREVRVSVGRSSCLQSSSPYCVCERSLARTVKQKLWNTAGNFLNFCVFSVSRSTLRVAKFNVQKKTTKHIDCL